MYCTGDFGDIACSVGGGPVGDGPTYAGCAADGLEETSGPNDCYTFDGDTWTPSRIGPILPGNTGDDGTGGQLSIYQRALQGLSTFSTSKPNCLKDLSAVGLTSSEVDSLAANANFISYTNATANQQAAMLTSGADLATNYTINTIYYVTPNLANLSYSAALGEMLHEIIHLSGFGGPVGPNQDSALQKALHLKVTGTQTDKISKKLAKDCFKGAQ
jgi:hypothetical protein